MKTIRVLLALCAVLFVVGWTPTSGTSVTGAWTLVCSEEDVRLAKSVGFKVHNTGANAFTDCVVESWVGPASTDWVTYYSWTSCKTLAAGASTFFELMGNVNERLRVRAKSAAGTTAACRPYGN